ncbi:hypothetical protein, partial [Pseudomonas syringae group sp. J309-1]|uniref:hypothetical protein n=1 Tax=Pseudomonas syringae group sp. J309-1 TaxID=3079588 RepID=UPI002914BCD7
VALGDDRFQCRGGLLESGSRLGGVTSEFTEAKPEPKERVAIRMEVVAELGCEGRRVRWQDTIAPNDRPRLSARDEAPTEACGRG